MQDHNHSETSDNPATAQGLSANPACVCGPQRQCGEGCVCTPDATAPTT